MPYVIRRLDLQALPSCSAYNRQEMPDSPVVYVIHEGATIVYAGATKSLFNRWSAHVSDWRLERMFQRGKLRVTWIKADINQFAEIESALIAFLNPLVNVVRKGKTYFHSEFHGRYGRQRTKQSNGNGHK